VHASAEIAGTKRTAGCSLISDAKDGLGVVAHPIENEQVGASAAESVAREKLVLAKLVIFSDRLANVMRLNWIPEGHSWIVGHDVMAGPSIGSSRARNELVNG